MRLERRGHVPSRVNLTPLIDVVFILLVFFMLTFNLSDWGAVALSVPAREAAAPAPAGLPQQPLLLRIHPDSRVDVNGEPLTGTTLADRIAHHLDTAANPGVIVQPSGPVPLQDVVDLLDELAALGVPQVSLVR